MHIKRYESADLESALARVRRELGPDALILSSRRVRKGGGAFGWLSRSAVEVVAASERTVRPDRPTVAPDPSWNGLLVSKALIDPLEAQVRTLTRSLEGLRADHDRTSGILGELRTLRLAVGRMAENKKGDVEAGTAGAMLEALGLATRHADSIGSEAARRSQDDGSDLDAQVEAVLTERIESATSPSRSDRKRVHFVVGSPGVGKTTSVAKALGRAPRPDKLAAVSTDSLRLGGDATLRGFAEKLGVSFGRACSADDLLEEVRRAGRRSIWIDTPGTGRRDRVALDDLKDMRDRLGRRAEVELVVSATTKERDLRKEIERHRSLAPSALIVTRTDESDDLSSVMNVLLDGDAPPLRWLGNGQRVPDDLELPEPSALAKRILGGVV